MMKADAQSSAEKEALEWAVDYFRESRDDLNPDSDINRRRDKSDIECLAHLHGEWLRDEPGWLDESMVGLITESETSAYHCKHLRGLAARLIELDKTLGRPLRDFVVKFLMKPYLKVRGLLNAGYRRGAVAGRCVMHGKTVTTEEVSAYAPVAIDGLGWLPDTIMSRSIIIRMRRRHAGEKIEPFRQRIHEQQGHKLREQIEIWAKARKKAKDIAWPELPEGIEDRDADIWESLIAIGDVIGGDW